MTDDILFQRLSGKRGDIGEILLDRPRALNSLNKKMCMALRAQLNEWQKDEDIKAVIIKGSGDRAFCAGGDVKSLYANKDDPLASEGFFSQEYQMNKAIYHFNKPYISFLDGLTMGGGAGVSIHGSHRVASEYFRFAMPETLIGFFPDIGAAHFLNQCPGKFGMYLALTGSTINAGDALAFKLINHSVPRDRLLNLTQKLRETEFDSDDFNAVSCIIDKFKMDLPEPEVLPHRVEIDHCFSEDCVELILDRLSEAASPFSNQAIRTLLARSPTSLKVTFAHLNQAESLSFDQIMQMDFNIAHGFLYSHDFYEGVRAVLVDKDQAPKWQPPNLSDIGDADVAKFFTEIRLLGECEGVTQNISTQE